MHMRKFEKELVQSLREALDHARGTKSGARVRLVVAPQTLASSAPIRDIDRGRLAADGSLANPVRSGRKQP
jgi:hypothetical protein